MSRKEKEEQSRLAAGQSSYHLHPEGHSVEQGHRMAAPSHSGSGYWGLWAHTQLRWHGDGEGDKVWAQWNKTPLRQA